MANANTFFAFMAGALTGAAIAILTTTDKGERVLEKVKNKGDEWLDDGREIISKGLDTLERALEKNEDDPFGSEEA